MASRSTRAFILLALALALASSACSKKKSREARVEAQIAKLEVAIEGHELGEVKEMLTEDFTDRRGHDRKEAINILQAAIFQQRGLHIYQEFSGPVRFPRQGEAEVEVYAAVSGTPMPNFDQLAKLSARLFHIKVKLREIDGGDWKIREIKWRFAEVSELLE